MAIPVLESVKAIEQQYRTGEEPVLVMCSDMNAYICKYMRSSAAAYKLACELIGSLMAMAWQLETPDIAFVRIKSAHWAGRFAQHCLSAPSLGSKQMEGVVDVTPSTYGDVASTTAMLRQLMKIALFDFWIANEDRNANNANLLYDVSHGRLVSIDYGCILNTATFDYAMSQLTTTDTILWSDLFQHLAKSKDRTTIDAIVSELKTVYTACLKRSKRQVKQIVEGLPKEWNVSGKVVEEKLQQLFDEQWTAGVWDNFVECLNENISNG
jgi:hypothetical protein